MTYDRQMAKVEKAGLRPVREGLIAGAGGRVLEIGGGTGANLALYGPAVESLTITEPETPMLRRLERKVREEVAADEGAARSRRGSSLRGRQLRRRCVDPGAVRGGRPAPRRPRDRGECCDPAAGCCSSSTCASAEPSRRAEQDRMNWLQPVLVV